MTWSYIGAGIFLLVVAVHSATWDVAQEPWSQGKVRDVDVRPDKHWAWHYIARPEFTEVVEKQERTLNRGKKYFNSNILYNYSSSISGNLSER